MTSNSSGTLAFSSFPAPSLSGAEILSFQANRVTDYTRSISMGMQMNHGAVDIQAASFCNASIAHTHLGLNDKVNSYWTSCSQGDHQSMMLAQRFPEAFDGIAASASAINWSGIFVGDLWARVIMNTMNIYPHMCEMQAITAAVITACDANDGLVNGIIADPDSCGFDPTTLVGTTINCTEIGENFTISSGAAYLTQDMWDSPRKSDNSSLFLVKAYALFNQVTTHLQEDHLLLPNVQATELTFHNFVPVDDNFSLAMGWLMVSSLLTQPRAIKIPLPRSSQTRPGAFPADTFDTMRA
ncbi:hypothetical protein BHYA_0531g00010 [Botrytis hyacinthi]|uniref:Carboxylic ester hydrolase n=1 Tax=Botrytis hyacinthi TaxID=278943 RepID=A0A4Z1G3H3_9HELO|nr:hypothetical protein BHYA_0531g00010 [Botrytis hyacinthi]